MMKSESCIILDSEEKMHLDEADAIVDDRLIEKNLVLSNEKTPADGNCFVWAMIDQCGKDPIWKKHYNSNSKSLEMVTKMRKLITSTLTRALSNKILDWNNVDPEKIETPDQWKQKISKNGEFCGHLAVQMISEALCRDIIIIPVIQSERGPDTIKVTPLSKTSRKKPFHLLYFSEARFLCGGHYQSIFPCQDQNNSELSEPQNIPEQEISEIVQNRASIDSMPDNFNNFKDRIPPEHQSSRINDTSVASFRSEYLEESDSSPIIFKKPKKVLKRQNPKINESDVDIPNKIPAKKSRKPSKPTNSMDSGEMVFSAEKILMKKLSKGKGLFIFF